MFKRGLFYLNRVQNSKRLITPTLYSNFNFKNTLFIKQCFNNSKQQQQQNNNHNNIIKSFYCTTTTHNNYNNNNEDLSESNLLNNINSIKSVEILPKDGVPQNFQDLYNKIINFKDINKLNTNQRLLASRFLWRYYGITNASPSTLNENDLDKLWNYLNIDTNLIENKQERESIELQQLIICLHSRYLIGKLNKLMNDISKRDIDSLSEKLILQCFLISPHLSRWDDMLKYGSKINFNILEQLNTESYFSHEYFSYPTIYNLLINNKNNNNGLTTTTTITNTSDNNDNNVEVHPWTQYNIHSFGFKNNIIKCENVEKDTFEKVEKEYYDEMKLLNSKITDKDGYTIANLGQVKYVLIFGGAVKLFLEMGTPQIVCGGIINHENQNDSNNGISNNIQLFGKLHYENEKNDLMEIQSEYSLKKVDNISNNISDDSISLIGSHVLSYTNLNTMKKEDDITTCEKYTYTMDVKINLIKNK